MAAQTEAAPPDNAQSAAAIEQLYAVYHQPLLRHLQRLVANAETAEDLMHETFIKALLHWHELNSVAATSKWLYRIATNTAYDYLRRRRRVEMLSLNEDTATDITAPAVEAHWEDAEPILAALHQLPEHYRTPLLLISAGYDTKDIATAMGLNLNTIKTRTHRARAQFRHHYAA